MAFTQKMRDLFEEQGYYVAQGLYSPREAAFMRDHFMQRRAEGPKAGDMGGDKTKSASDPLNLYPRMINMHNWDENTNNWQKDNRLMKLAGHLIGDDVLLCQTMLYFKPPGARGQAFHQDNQYIRKFPIIAAWTALDDCDADNGQMVMIPGSNKCGILPVQPADRAISFTNGQSYIPEGLKEVGVDMKAGDVLFFGGFTIHGSYPNKTKDRFRRAFITHYYGAHTEELPVDATTNMASIG